MTLDLFSQSILQYIINEELAGQDGEPAKLHYRDMYDYLKLEGNLAFFNWLLTCVSSHYLGRALEVEEPKEENDGTT